MTQVFGVNSANGLYLDSSNNIAILRDLPAITQACETATKAQLGEMVLATSQGIPNFETIWIGTPNYSLYSSYLRNTLQAINGVQEVSSLTLKTLENMLSYTATIKTSFGSGNISV